MTAKKMTLPCPSCKATMKLAYEGLISRLYDYYHCASCGRGLHVKRGPSSRQTALF
ncbi:MAG: hypothetical protein GYA24_13410 [Candidatus Lokiarchaeota archaeon]|nr:hypothetical protein [Candidatus Lokiarchaeota archaeon]